MLSLVGVGKEYNLRPVLEDVHLTIEPGVSYLLSAPNGSGKSTLLQIMAGLTRPTAGKVLWDGNRLTPAFRKKIGVVLQQPMLFGDLTAAENLSFYGRVYAVPSPQKTAETWVERLGLSDAASLKVREFSKGMRQRLSLARALLHEPNVLLLDEPFDGLDTGAREGFRHLFADVSRKGTSLFMVTHQPDEIELNGPRLTLRYGRVMAT